MLFLKVFILLILVAILIQDCKSRSVYWIFFPLLGASFTLLFNWQNNGLNALWVPSIINFGFIALLIILLTIYFSVKNRAIINIFKNMLGLGDVLFLLSICFYLSVLNFLFFYVVSLVCTLLSWVAWQTISYKKQQEIPLAGFQSLILIIFLCTDWWISHFDLTNDYWLSKLIKA